MIGGVRGDITGDWTYDVSYSYGKSDRTQVDAGYTNVQNIANAIDAVSTTHCRGGQPGCVPINVFGGYGTITPAMAGYAGATALEQQLYDQLVINGVRHRCALSAAVGRYTDRGELRCGLPLGVGRDEA